MEDIYCMEMSVQINVLKGTQKQCMEPVENAKPIKIACIVILHK